MGPALQKLCRQAVRRGGVLPRPPFTENTTVNRVGGQGRPPLQPFNVPDAYIAPHKSTPA